MKKIIRCYFIAWLVALVVFNVIAFVTPGKIDGTEKYDGTFWIGYIFISLAFIIHLFLAWYALKDDINKTFYRFPLISLSLATLIVMLIVGSLCMALPGIPAWIGIVICVLILGISILFFVNAEVVSTLVGRQDQSVKEKKIFIQSLTLELDSLMKITQSSEIGKEVKRVYEAVRYSDPMSAESLSGIEAQITLKVNEFINSVKDDDFTLARKLADEAIVLVNDRNNRCKILK